VGRKRSKVCSVPGCGEILNGSSSKCSPHRRTANRERDKRTGRIRGARWSALRTRVLREQPFCNDGRICGGLATSVEVDHITPLAFGGHPTSRDNLQGICRECHDVKTREEQRQLGQYGGGGQE